MAQANWDKLVNDYEHLMGKLFTGNNGKLYTFLGLLHSDDDYYYMMVDNNTREFELITCCVKLEDYYFPF